MKSQPKTQRHAADSTRVCARRRTTGARNHAPETERRRDACVPTRTALHLLISAIALGALLLGCHDTPGAPVTLDLYARHLPGQCGLGDVRWQTIHGPELQTFGYRQTVGDRCAFDLSLRAGDRLSLRVERLRGQAAPRGPVRIRVLAIAEGDHEHELYAGALGARAMQLGGLEMRSPTMRLVTEVLADPGRTGQPGAVAWSDLRVVGDGGGAPRDPARWSRSIAAAAAHYLSETKLPRAVSHETDAPPRLLVIGIDGASWPLLDGLIAEGRLPRIAALRARGRHGVLRSTVIPESAMAWTSIRTGVHPGKHGVTTFVSLDGERSSYWRWLSDAGLLSVVIGVPKSRPRERFHGLLVGGWNLDADHPYTHPRELQRSLDIAHYDPHIVHVRNAGYFAERMVERTDLALALLGGLDWRHAFVVYEYSDTAGHVFGLETDAWKQCYALLDAQIGRVLDTLPPDTTVLVVSDHGWKRFAGSFAPRSWLVEQGLSPWITHVYGGNRVGLGRPGSPDPGSYEETRELARIEAALRTLHEPGGSRSIFRRLIPASEAFAGPFAERTFARGVVELVPDYHAAAKLERAEGVVDEPMEHHDIEGLYLLAGPQVEPGAGRAGSVVDVARTVTHYFDVAPPADLDGEPLWDFGRVPGAPAPERAKPTVPDEAPESSPDAHDSEDPAASGEASRELKESLRALGYVEE